MERPLFLAYVDESGSTGAVAKGGSRSYTLGCVLVRSSQWGRALDGLVGYRRFLRDRFEIPVRSEIKANHLLRNSGAFRDLGLGDAARHAIYRGCLRLCAKLDLKVFAVVVRKELLSSADPHRSAWTFLLQRLERMTTKLSSQVLIFHDEGDELRVRALARLSRRAGTAGSAFGPGFVKVPFRGLVDDPVSRRSHESLFLRIGTPSCESARRVRYRVLWKPPFPPPTLSPGRFSSRCPGRSGTPRPTRSCP